MIRFLSSILNLPYTILGILTAIISIPKLKISYNLKPFAIILYAKKFWWAKGHMKGARATARGQVVILGPNLEKNDLEHELVHVEQHLRLPLIFPFLYLFELLRKGYRKNKYEDEAYTRAGNVYKGKVSGE